MSVRDAVAQITELSEKKARRASKNPERYRVAKKNPLTLESLSGDEILREDDDDFEVARGAKRRADQGDVVLVIQDRHGDRMLMGGGVSETGEDEKKGEVSKEEIGAAGQADMDAAEAAIASIEAAITAIETDLTNVAFVNVSNEFDADQIIDGTLQIDGLSTADSALTRTMQGVELEGGAMNTTAKYTPALKFTSRDAQFTTENPKLLAAIIGRATQTYNDDSDGGMAIDFATTPDNPGPTSVPTVRMSLTEAGRLDLSVQGSTGGLLIGGDAKLYRSNTNELKTDGKFVAALGLDSGAQKITSVLAGTAATDAANVGQSALLASANVFSAVNTFTLANAPAVLLRSGAAGSHTSLSIGRTAAEGVLGIAGGPGHFFTETVAGDIALRNDDSTKTLYVGLGTGSPQLKIANTLVTVNTDLSVAGAGVDALRLTASDAGMTLGGDTMIYRSVAGQINVEHAGLTVWDIRNSAAASSANEARAQLVVNSSTTPRVAARFDGSLSTTTDASRVGLLELVMPIAGTAVNALEIENGQLRLPIVGSTAGLLLGGDASIYRSNANEVTTEALVCTSINTGNGAVELAAGVYTPALTNAANVAASTAFECQYMRVGNMVTVSGRVDIDPTANATETRLGIALPIASALTSAQDCAGTAGDVPAAGTANQSGAVRGDATNDRAELVFTSDNLSNIGWFFQFLYEVK